MRRSRPIIRKSRPTLFITLGKKMTAPVRQQDGRIDPVAVFIARAEARALLYAASEFDPHEAVDKLQADAERDGLVAAIGQDEVQRIIAEAFAAVGDWP